MRYVLITRSCFAATLTLAAADVAAQAGPTSSLTTISTNPGTYPISVVLAPGPGNTKYAISSMWASSQQLSINVTNPNAPVMASTSTTSQDQYCRAVYTRANGGRLITAHRFGNIRAWDASPGMLNSPLPAFSPTPTNYSHEGLKTFSHPLGEFVYYSEQHTSPSGVGGLMLYRLMPNDTLSLVGSNLVTASAGGALAVGENGYIVWQLGDAGNNQLNGQLRTYSNNFTGNPVLTSTLPAPFTTANGDRYLEANRSETTLVSTLGWDGFRCYSLANLFVPSPGMSFSMPGLYVRGVTFVPNTDVAVVWGFVQQGNVYFDFVMFANTTPYGALIPSTIFPASFFVTDIKATSTHLYAVGYDRTTQNSLLWIVP